MGEASKVEFALGSEVTAGQLFKSSFARAFFGNYRDTKSLDFVHIDNGTIDEEPESTTADNRNNNYYSLMDFEKYLSTNATKKVTINSFTSIWKTNESAQNNDGDAMELEKLRKQCQILTEENRRLQCALSANHVPQVRAIDNVFLQTQVDTLQWQLKQLESNREMYRSLMDQVVCFLDRARKSLDILHEKKKKQPKSKSSPAARVPRSRSVHAVHEESASPGRGLSHSTSSSSDTKRFARAKSVTQISPGASSIREFARSLLRRNEVPGGTPASTKKQPVVEPKNMTPVVAYKKPKLPELNPDEIPPEKLSQEAFRLMRTVQSLLSMREPELARVTPTDDRRASMSPSVEHQRNLSLTLQRDSGFVNSTVLPEPSFFPAGGSGSDRGNESSVNEADTGKVAPQKSFPGPTDLDGSLLRQLLPGVRKSIDATSLNSGSSKTTTEEEDAASPSAVNAGNGCSASNGKIEGSFAGATSTPVRRPKKQSSGRSSRSKPTSVSSAEYESGFSSMTSFQEVGLPSGALPLSPIKGLHGDVGLPDVPPLNFPANHRRWSSTPVEIKAFSKRRTSAGTNPDSLSIWV